MKKLVNGITCYFSGIHRVKEIGRPKRHGEERSMVNNMRRTWRVLPGTAKDA